MKMYCISDAIDTAVGLKLSGVETVVVDKKDEIEDIIEKVLEDKNIGILIITENIYNMQAQKFDKIRMQYKTPLLVKI